MESFDTTVQLINCSGVLQCQELQQNLISEAHASLFSGQLSERKVYDRLRRRFWWQGMRADG